MSISCLCTDNAEQSRYLLESHLLSAILVVTSISTDQPFRSVLTTSVRRLISWLSRSMALSVLMCFQRSIGKRVWDSVFAQPSQTAFSLLASKGS